MIETNHSQTHQCAFQHDCKLHHGGSNTNKGALLKDNNTNKSMPLKGSYMLSLLPTKKTIAKTIIILGVGIMAFYAIKSKLPNIVAGASHSSNSGNNIRGHTHTVIYEIKF